MGKATYIGTVVANSSQEEAITSFLKTINRTNKESKAIFSISESSDRVFLTSLSDIAKPFSPLTGKLSPVLRTADVAKIAKALSLNSTNEITAKGNFSLQSSQCKHCQSTIVSDNKRLLKFCIVCGSEQEQEDDGEERVLLSIYNDEYEYEKPPVTVREDIDERAWTPDNEDNQDADLDCEDEECEDDEIEAMLAEDDDQEQDEEDAAYDALEDESDDLESDEESDELDEEDEEYSEDEIEAMLAEDDEAEIDSEIDSEECEDDEIEAMLAEDDEELEIDESAFKEMMNASNKPKSKAKSKVKTKRAFKSHSSEESQEDVDVEGFNEDEIEAMLSGDDEEEQVKNILNDSEFNDVDLEGLEDQDSEELDSEELELEEAPDYAKVNDISEDDKLEVDLVEDGLNNSETLANSTVNMLYVPSETVSNHRWYAIVNDTPVAVATVQSVGAQKAGIFATESFRKATEALMAQIGIAAALRDMGFKSLKVKLPVKQIVESQVRQAVAEANAISQRDITNMRNDIKAALATASVGINKGFFSKLSNPIKAELYDALSTAGVRNAEILIDDAFCSRSDDYHRSLIDQAFDLMKKPVEARNEISEAVMSANYQRSSVDETSLSHSVSKQLSSLGSSLSANSNSPQATENLPSFNERASMVMRNLVR